MRRILIVEDDEAISSGLALNLGIEGYTPYVVHDGESALAWLEEERPILVLLDISLPGISGLDVLDRIRSRTPRLPFIVLSARREEFDKVAALRLGADDYVTKPFALAELLARITAVLRRTDESRYLTPPVLPPPVVEPETREPAAPAPRARERNGVTRFGDITVDLIGRTVERIGTELKLTHLEFELLAHFMARPMQVCSRDALLRAVWGVRAGSPRTVDNFVAQLRAKLESDPEQPRHLVTVRGSGYRFDP